MAIKAKVQGTKVTTGLVRFSYAHVFEPYSADGEGKEKYSVSLIIKKSDKDTIKAIEAAIAAAKEEGKGSKFGGKIPNNLQVSFRDGDEEREDDEVYADCMFVNANSNRKPGVVGTERDDFGDLEPITDEEEFYSGCYGRATINFYAYNFNGKKGIAAGLGNLQKLEDGDRLGGGGASAQSDFGDDD